MSKVEEQIEKIEKEIRETPYHKATEHHIGMLRAKLSKLRSRLEDRAGRSSGGGGVGYAVKKQGDATVVLVGPPSVGKSTLLNKLTNAKSKIAPYAFTTVTVVPGMMEYKDANIQILDVPGLIREAEEGKGRGKEVLSVVRGADLLLIMCDVNDPEAVERIKNALENAGIRIDKNPPMVNIEKKLKGGIDIISNIDQELDKNTITSVAEEFGYKNAEITLKQSVTLEELIDVFSKNRVYIPSLTVVNKIDKKSTDGSDPKPLQGTDILYISAEKTKGLEKLKEVIWKKLNFVRVYLVRRDEKPSKKNPLVVKQGRSLEEVAETIGTEFAEEKTRAKIWGAGAKFPEQEVSLSTKVQEGMQVRFI